MGYTTLVVTLVLLGSQVRASSSAPSDSTDSGSPASSSGAPSTSVQWTSPTSGDTFGPGERINIKWQAPGKTSSPSFRVCEESGDCGSTIWPQIQQTGEVYATIVTAPKAETRSGYYLQMTDDTGQVTNTPVFNLSPNPQSASTASNTGTAEPPNADTGNNDPPPSPTTVSTPAPPNAPNQDPMSIPATPVNSTEPVTHSPMSAAVTHNQPPTLALAIPLSIVGAILLAALVLACHHRRKLAVDRANEAILLRDAERSVSVQGFGGFHGQAALDELSRRSSLVSSESTRFNEKAPLPKLDMDVEKALLISALLTKMNGPSDTPTDPRQSAIHTSLPPPSPPREPEPRTSTRQPFPAHLIPGLALNREPPAPSALPYQSVLSRSQSQKLYQSGLESAPSLATIPESTSITSDVLSSYLTSPVLDLHKDTSVEFTHPQAPTFSRNTTWATLPIPPALRVHPDLVGRKVVKTMSSREEEGDNPIDRVRAWATSGTSLYRNSSSASTLVASASLGSADREKPLPANPSQATRA